MKDLQCFLTAFKVKLKLEHGTYMRSFMIWLFSRLSSIAVCLKFFGPLLLNVGVSPVFALSVPFLVFPFPFSLLGWLLSEFQDSVQVYLQEAFLYLLQVMLGAPPVCTCNACFCRSSLMQFLITWFSSPGLNFFGMSSIIRQVFKLRI